MIYRPGITMDDRDKEERKRLQPPYENSIQEDGFLQLCIFNAMLAIFVYVLDVVSDLTNNSPVGLLVFPLGIYAIYRGTKAMVATPKNPDGTPYDLEKSMRAWYSFMSTRRHRYYGPCDKREWVLGNTLMGTTVCYNHKYEHDPWTSPDLQGHLLNPEKLLIPKDDGTYDYSKYFEEMMYNHRVHCTRLREVPYVLNCVESAKYSLLGIADKLDPTDYKPFIRYKRVVTYVGTEYEKNIPMKTYPMDKRQLKDFRNFDYRAVDRNTGWILDAWEKAGRRVYDEVNEHKPFKPYNMGPASAYQECLRSDKNMAEHNMEKIFERLSDRAKYPNIPDPTDKITHDLKMKQFLEK